MRVVIAFLFLPIIHAASSGHKSVAAIQKIIEMLSDMQAKGKQEKQDEQVRFASFKQFCESTTGEKQTAITTSNEAIEQLTAAIAKAEADASILGKEVTGHEGDMDTWSAELKAAAEERKKAHAAFVEAHKEYSNSIDSVERALSALEKKSSLAQTSNVFSLLQTQGRKMQKHQRQVLMSFLQRSDPGKALLQEAEAEGIEVAPPEAAVYESSSGGIIDMIEKLGDKFSDEKRELEKRETNEKNAHMMMAADLQSSIEEAGMQVGTKKSTKATRLSDAAEAKGDLADTKATLAEDEKFLKDLNAECEQKSFDFQARQTVRTGEIEAIGKAIEIMSSPEVSKGGAHTGLVQQAVSLAQLRSTDRSSTQDRVATFLAQRGQQINSRVLSLLSARAASDPFKKVKKMIQDMIGKLMEEANEEAGHKAFCDAEMSTNQQTRDSKTEEADGLQADIEEFTADISKLGGEITDLGEQIAAIDASVSKATAEREEEKAKNAATIADATSAEAAVSQAITVLKDFYAKAATPIEQPAPQQGPIAWDPRALQLLTSPGAAASLLQQRGRVPGAPEMEEGQYQGMGNGGVLGLMEVCQDDFAKVQSETSATESDSAKIYDEFMADADQDKAVKNMDLKHKQNARQAKESKLATAKKDLRITQDELAAAMAYYDKLKPSCQEKVVSYEDRVAQRKAEIESLKEALEILAPEN